jgi:hypothetical protein
VTWSIVWRFLSQREPGGVEWSGIWAVPVCVAIVMLLIVAWCAAHRK